MPADRSPKPRASLRLQPARHGVAGVLMAATASIGLAGCGASSAPSTTVKVASAPSSHVATATTASTPAAKPPVATTAAGHTAATRTVTAATAAAAPGRPPLTRHAITVITAPTSAPTVAPNVASASSSDVPAKCLDLAGALAYVKGPIRGIWQGSHDPTFPLTATVYVDGPYKSTNAADKSAATLQPVDHAERGGLYVVSAELRSHGTNVHAVAVCLDGGGPNFQAMKAKQPKQKTTTGSYKF